MTPETVTVNLAPLATPEETLARLLDFERALPHHLDGLIAVYHREQWGGKVKDGPGIVGDFEAEVARLGADAVENAYTSASIKHSPEVSFATFLYYWTGSPARAYGTVELKVQAGTTAEAEKITEAAVALWEQPGPIARPCGLSRPERAARRHERRVRTRNRLKRLRVWLFGVLAGIPLGALFVATEPLPWLKALWHHLLSLLGLD